MEKEQQLSLQESIRRKREADPKKVAWRQALAFFPLVRDIGTEMGNKDQAFEKVLAHHFLNQSQIPFVGFWGEGGKDGIDKEDQKYLEELLRIRKVIARYYEHGASINIILADKHGVFNGFYKDPKSSPYLIKIRAMLEENNIPSLSLNDLYQKHGLELPNISDPVNPLTPAFNVYEKHKDVYKRHAGHHQIDKDSHKVAYHYVRMRLNERQMLGQEFPNSFLLVNGTKMASQGLLPTSMPIIYLNVGPVWFINSQ